jgi:hypothetical protein
MAVFVLVKSREKPLGSLLNRLDPRGTLDSETEDEFTIGNRFFRLTREGLLYRQTEYNKKYAGESGG